MNNTDYEFRVVNDGGVYSIRKCFFNEETESYTTTSEAFAVKATDIVSLRNKYDSTQEAFSKPVIVLPKKTATSYSGSGIRLEDVSVIDDFDEDDY